MTTYSLALPRLAAPWGVARRLAALGLALSLPAATLLLWSLAAARGWVNPLVLPGPARVLDTLLELHASGELWSQLFISLTRVAYGYAAGVAVGLALGVAMGLSKTVEAYVLPTFKALSLIPVLGWVPLFIMLVGIEEALKVLVIAKAVSVPVTINALKGIRNIPAGQFEVACVYRFSRLRTLTALVIPAALPSLAGGLRLGLANAWMSLVAVELLASSEGIGYLMVWGRQLFQLDVVLATIVVIGLTGWLLDLILQRAERRLLAWRKTAY